MRKGIVFVSAVVAIFGLAQMVAAQGHFTRGDSNHDGKIDISDGVSTLGWLFLGLAQPKCLDAADVNDSSEIDIADAIYTFNFLFGGGPPPAKPYPVFEADPTDDGLSCLEVVDVAGSIARDTTWTNDKAYRLADAVFVEPGVTLTIEAGTTVLGAVGLAEGKKPVLVARAGSGGKPSGRLVAVGLPNRPIVFTSEKKPGERAIGDWGGVILLGQAHVNVPGGVLKAEGLLPDQFMGCGPNQPPPSGDPADCSVEDDDSGHLEYVRIEYGGFPISPDNEVNGLSLFATGSKTKLNHIQVKFNDDDGFEWFGGTSSLKYGLVTFVSDDYFDYSYGWRGQGQFWVALSSPDIANSENGFEVDNSEAGVGAFEDTPRTMPTISNATLVGKGDPGAGGKAGTGFLLRRGAGTRLYNFIVQGFTKGGFDVDDAASCDMLAVQPDGLPGTILDHGIFYDNVARTGSPPVDRDTPWVTDSDEPLRGDPACSSEAVVRSGANTLISPANPPTRLTKPYDLLNPDFRPVNDALANVLDPTTLGSFFEPATFRGGVAPDVDWTKEPWISYLQN